MGCQSRAKRIRESGIGKKVKVRRKREAEKQMDRIEREKGGKTGAGK